MEFLDSLYTSIFGIAVVFLVLVVMIFMIYLLATGVRMASKPKPVVIAADNYESAPAIELAPPPSDPQNLKLIDVDEKTAAMIMAIVCDETGTPPNELYFKSIRLIQNQETAQVKGV